MYGRSERQAAGLSLETSTCRVEERRTSARRSPGHRPLPTVPERAGIAGGWLVQRLHVKRMIGAACMGLARCMRCPFPER